MNFCNIHISHLITLNIFKIKTNLFKEISNNLIVKKYFGISVNIVKYKCEVVHLKFNKNYVFFKTSKFKINNSREYDLLCYIGKLKYLEKSKFNSSVFNWMITNKLFPSKSQKMERKFYEYVKEVERVFESYLRLPTDAIHINYVRIYFIKNSTFFADQSLIRLELSNYLYLDLKLNNPGLVLLLNEYYNLTNNLLNISFIEKNKIQPAKNLLKYVDLPNKILDENFKVLRNMPLNYVLFELFINKYCKNFNELKSIREYLINFCRMINQQNNLKVNKTLNMSYMIESRRRQSRVDLKKYFRNKNLNLKIFFDDILYFENQYENFISLTQGFVEHIEEYYI